MHDHHFFKNCGSFQYNISWFCFDFSKNYHNFERNEDRATVLLKWTDFCDYTVYLLFNLNICPRFILPGRNTETPKRYSWTEELSNTALPNKYPKLPLSQQSLYLLGTYKKNLSRCQTKLQALLWWPWKVIRTVDLVRKSNGLQDCKGHWRYSELVDRSEIYV